MQVVSAREFRSNQGKFLNAAMSGQSLLRKAKARHDSSFMAKLANIRRVAAVL